MNRGRPKYTKLTRQNHPELVEAYEQYCLLNGIHQPPELWSSRLYIDSARMDKRNNRVILGPDFMDSTIYSISEQLAVIAHEMGHEHENYHQIPARIRQERDADGFAVGTIGSSEPLACAIEKFCNRRDAQVAADLKSPDEYTREDARIRQDVIRDKASLVYGELSDRLTYIRDTDRTDRSQVDKLIASRNKRMAACERVG